MTTRSTITLPSALAAYGVVRVSDRVLYRSKGGLGYQCAAVVTRTISSTRPDPEKFLPALDSAQHVDLLVHGRDSDYREFNVTRGEGRGQWGFFEIPGSRLDAQITKKPPVRFPAGTYVKNRATGSVLLFTKDDTEVKVVVAKNAELYPEGSITTVSPWLLKYFDTTEKPAPAPKFPVGSFIRNPFTGTVLKVTEADKAAEVVIARGSWGLGDIRDLGSYVRRYSLTDERPEPPKPVRPFKNGDVVRLGRNGPLYLVKGDRVGLLLYDGPPWADASSFPGGWSAFTLAAPYRPAK